MGLPGKEGTKRGHGQQNLELEITASVTICQVRNKVCELNALQGSLPSGSAERYKRTNAPPNQPVGAGTETSPHPCENQPRKDGPPKIVLKGAATREAATWLGGHSFHRAGTPIFFCSVDTHY
jgi:hypothetical protein